MYYKCYYVSPLGTLLLMSTSTQLVGAWFLNQKYYPTLLEKEAILKEELAILVRTRKWFDRYFNLEKPDPSALDICLKGTLFRKLVWEQLLEIPYGRTTTYGTVARKVASKMGKEKMSCRAVGSAIGHNPLSIIVPCHRVIGKNNQLTGYAASISIKQKLLEMENVFIEKREVWKREDADGVI